MKKVVLNLDDDVDICNICVICRFGDHKEKITCGSTTIDVNKVSQVNFNAPYRQIDPGWNFENR